MSSPPWRQIGPGLVVAATGVGAGDLVATLIAGERFGYTLAWAAVVGCVVKLSLAEAVGRWHLATDQTVFAGWTTLGRWTSWYFGPYILIWGFVYGATGMLATALPLAALFPAIPLRAWAVITGLAGLAFVWFNRYAAFERVMTVLVGVMFITVVGLAVILAPDLPRLIGGLRPTLPSGSFIYTLGLIGGVGGTITMAAYGYWVHAKGWRGTSWMQAMRWDNRVAYFATGLFVLSMLVVGAELLQATGTAVSTGDRGLLDLAAILEARVGRPVSVAFLIGFFATTFTSVLGVWHGVGHLFADFVDHARGRARLDGAAREQSPAFRFYLLWLTFPPLLLVYFGRPFQLIVAYGVLGAFFMPFLAVTLLWLLNSSRTPRAWRNGVVSNAGLCLAALLFVIVGAAEVWSLVSR